MEREIIGGDQKAHPLSNFQKVRVKAGFPLPETFPDAIKQMQPNRKLRSMEIFLEVELFFCVAIAEADVWIEWILSVFLSVCLSIYRQFLHFRAPIFRSDS